MHKKCATCKNQRNWQTLNQMPDALRKPIQAGMKHVRVDACRLLGMGAYDAVTL